MKWGLSQLFTLCVFCAGLAVSAPSYATDQGASGLPLPRFVTLASDEVNLRTGPGLKYPIDWVLVREGMPVEIVREFDAWREIKTVDGDTGWVHKSLLSGKRSAIVKGYTRRIYAKPSADARPIADVESDVIASLKECTESWCYLNVLTYDGWIEKDALWGAYDYEVFDQ